MLSDLVKSLREGMTNKFGDKDLSPLLPADHFKLVSVESQRHFGVDPKLRLDSYSPRGRDI